MAEIRILHAQETQAFACRLAAALAADGHSVIRAEAEQRERAPRAAEPLVVVWSPQMLRNEAAINEARAALAGRRLVPVAVGRIDPPASFAHLPPIDLAGWGGDPGDARWRFVCEEIELALRHKATARAELYSDDEDETAAEIEPDAPYIIPVRMIAGVAASLALVAIAVVVTASLAGPKREIAAAPAPALATLAQAPARSEPEPPSESQADPAETATANEEEAAPLSEREPAVRPLPAAVQISALQPGEAFDPQSASLDQEGAGEASAGDAAAPESGMNGVMAQGVDPSTERLAAPAEALADAPDAAAEEAPAGSLAESLSEELAPPPAALLPAKPVDDYLGVVFRDCLNCPDMVEAPAGAFAMGANDGPTDGAGDPARSAEPPRVQVVSRFAIARREVTFAQWDACVAAGGCRAYSPADEGFGRGQRPVINVSYADAERYAEWLRARTGHAYRLPSEAEWEYAARAGAPAQGAGSPPSPQRANYDGALKSDEPEPVSIRMTTPTGSYPANAFGLYDAEGNVWEWTADCWTPSHDGTANADCSQRVVKGGAYDSSPALLRPGSRMARAETAREPVTGFRVVRDLD